MNEINPCDLHLALGILQEELHLLPIIIVFHVFLRWRWEMSCSLIWQNNKLLDPDLSLFLIAIPFFTQTLCAHIFRELYWRKIILSDVCRLINELVSIYFRLQEVKSQPQNWVVDSLFNDPWTNAFKWVMIPLNYYPLNISEMRIKTRNWKLDLNI